MPVDLREIEEQLLAEQEERKQRCLREMDAARARRPRWVRWLETVLA
jgi:hypothetical protein